MTYTEIENTDEARRAPPDKYRLLLAGHDDRRGLYHVEDFDRAEDALQAADELRRSRETSGWGIVHDSKGFILAPMGDGGMQMRTRESLLKSFGQPRVSDVTGSVLERALTDAHIDAIEALQPERLPGWRKGDHMMVFWQDIEDATGARAYPGDVYGQISG